MHLTVFGIQAREVSMLYGCFQLIRRAAYLAYLCDDTNPRYQVSREPVASTMLLYPVTVIECQYDLQDLGETFIVCYYPEPLASPRHITCR